MARRNITQSTMKQIRDVQIPTWWFLAQVVFGFVFVLVLAWSFLSSGADVPDADPPLASPGAPLSGGPRPGDGRPSQGESESAAATGTVQVPGADGSSNVEIPVEAFDLGKRAFAALYDPAVAATVVTSDGGGFVSQYEPSKHARVADVLVSEHDTASITFIALVDPDGDRGPKPSQYLTVTLANDDGTWKVSAY